MAFLTCDGLPIWFCVSGVGPVWLPLRLRAATSHRRLLVQGGSGGAQRGTLHRLPGDHLPPLWFLEYPLQRHISRLVRTKNVPCSGLANGRRSNSTWPRQGLRRSPFQRTSSYLAPLHRNSSPKVPFFYNRAVAESPKTQIEEEGLVAKKSLQNISLHNVTSPVHLDL